MAICLYKIQFSFSHFKIFWQTQPEPTSIMSESNISLSDSSILQKAYQIKQLTCLKVTEDRAHCIITKRYGKSWVAFSAGVNFVLEFLFNLFSEGPEYRTIKGYRTATSVYHKKVEGIPIGQYPKVHQLLSGVFNKRLSQSKYKIYCNMTYFQGNWWLCKYFK